MGLGYYQVVIKGYIAKSHCGCVSREAMSFGYVSLYDYLVTGSFFICHFQVARKAHTDRTTPKHRSRNILEGLVSSVHSDTRHIGCSLNLYELRFTAHGELVC